MNELSFKFKLLTMHYKHYLFTLLYLYVDDNFPLKEETFFCILSY